MALSHRILASWYTQLAQQVDAGLTLGVALKATAPTAPAAAARMVAVIERGGTVDDVLRAGGRWLPRSDLLALSAAARIGRMPATFRALAERHAQLHAVRRRLLLACLYPIALVHLGALLIPLTHLIDWEKGFRWDLLAYVRGVASEILPLWIAVALIVAAARRWPYAAYAVGTRLPGVSGYLRNQALADLAFILSGFVASDVKIGEAWAAVATLTPSRRLKNAASTLHATAERGRPPGEQMNALPVFPLEFTVRYRTGEQTGKLDETLAGLSRDCQDRANHSLTLAMFIYPALLFAVVAGAIAFMVVSVYSGYLKMLTKMAE